MKIEIKTACQLHDFLIKQKEKYVHLKLFDEHPYLSPNRVLENIARAIQKKETDPIFFLIIEGVIKERGIPECKMTLRKCEYDPELSDIKPLVIELED